MTESVSVAEEPTTEAPVETPKTEAMPKAQRRQQRQQQPKPEPVKDAVTLALEGVEVELQAQDDKWGDQRSHPFLGGGRVERNRRSFAEQAENWKQHNDVRSRVGNIGWDGILLEEVYEALSAETLAEQLVELEQVAAVAVNAIVSLKRQASA